MSEDSPSAVKIALLSKDVDYLKEKVETLQNLTSKMQNLELEVSKLVNKFSDTDRRTQQIEADLSGLKSSIDKQFSDVTNHISKSVHQNETKWTNIVPLVLQIVVAIIVLLGLINGVNLGPLFGLH